MVPGQVIDAETIGFMRKLDVKEIHGFNASLGLKLLRPSFVESLKGTHSNGGGKRAKPKVAHA